MIPKTNQPRHLLFCIQKVLWKTSCRFPEDNFCIILQNNGNPENSIKTVSSGCYTPRKARVFRHFQGLYLIPTRSHQPVSKRFCLGDLACGIHIIRIILNVLAIMISVVIVLSRCKRNLTINNALPLFARQTYRGVKKGRSCW